MPDIAGDGDAEVFEIFLVLANRQDVQQALSGMRLLSFTGIDQACTIAQSTGDVAHQADLLVADDEKIDCHGLDGQQGIQHGFAFRRGRGRDHQVDDLRPLAAGREFERNLGPGAGFKKQLADRQALERTVTGPGLPGSDQVAFRPIHQPAQQVPVQAIECDQVAKITLTVELFVHARYRSSDLHARCSRRTTALRILMNRFVVVINSLRPATAGVSDGRLPGRSDCG
ncbi:hypothetical protein MnTg04_01592 [bacterium MnTg04]|nr:hypothetical protein MnTg04_01592 [bacterium MnTg04]